MSTSMTPVKDHFPDLIIKHFTPEPTQTPSKNHQAIARIRCQLLEKLVSPLNTPQTARKLNLAQEEEKISDQQKAQWETEVRMLAATGQYEEAVKRCNEALKDNKIKDIAQRALADTYRYEGRTNKALEIIEQDFNQQDPVSQRIKGDILLAQSEFKEAIKAYDQAIELDKSQYRAYRNRSKCYYSLKDYDSALVDANAALKILPDDPFSLAQRARIYHKTGQFTKTALADCENAVSDLKVLFDDHKGSRVFLKEMLRANITLANLQIAKSNQFLKNTGTK